MCAAMHARMTDTNFLSIQSTISLPYPLLAPHQRVKLKVGQPDMPARKDFLQGSAKRRSPGLVNLVTAVAYHFCLALPAAFTQPGYHFFSRVLCPSYLASNHPSIRHSVVPRVVSVEEVLWDAAAGLGDAVPVAVPQDLLHRRRAHRLPQPRLAKVNNPATDACGDMLLGQS